MVEMMISLVIIAIVTTAALAFFINGMRSEDGQRQRQEAIFLADQQMQTVQAIPASDLVSGRSSTMQAAALTTSVATNLNLAGQSDVSSSASFDGDTSDPVLIPLSQTQTVNHNTYTIYTFIYACHLTIGSNSQCGSTGGTGTTQELRVTVASTWTSNANCSNGCSYATSTLIDPNSDQTFNTNISTPSGSITSPASTSPNFATLFNDNTGVQGSTPYETCTTGPAGNTVTVPGTEIVITGLGLKSNVRVWISSGGGSIPTNTIYQPSATEVDACVQTGDVPGNYTISVINTDGGHFQTTLTETPIVRWVSLTGSGASQVLTLHGGGFVNGATYSATGGVSGTFNWVSAQQATLTSYVGPNSGPATATTITVNDPAPGLKSTPAFTLPDISSTTIPTSVAVGTTVPVAITGTGFEPGLAIASTPAVVNASPVSVTYTSPTAAVVTIRATAVGTMSFALVNPDGGVSNTMTLTVDPLPTISPAPGPQLTSTPFTVSGTGFMTGITASITGGDTVAATYLSATQVQLTVSGTNYGSYVLTLRNADGGIVTTPITIDPRPVVTGKTVAVSGEVAEVLTGTGFQSNMTVTDGSGGTIGTITHTGSTQVSFLITGATGSHTLTLTNPSDGGTTTVSVTVDTPLHITAAETPVGAGSVATITGTGFVNGLTVSSTKGGASVTWVNATTANVTLTVTGSQVITLTNPDGGFDTATVVVNAAPNITGVALSPTTPTHSGTVAVTVTGTGFVNGATFTAQWTRSGTTTTNPTPTSVTFVNSGKETFNVAVPPTVSGTTTLYTLTVTITNPDGGTDAQALTGVRVL